MPALLTSDLKTALTAVKQHSEDSKQERDSQDALASVFYDCLERLVESDVQSSDESCEWNLRSELDSCSEVWSDTAEDIFLDVLECSDLSYQLSKQSLSSKEELAIANLTDLFSHPRLFQVRKLRKRVPSVILGGLPHYINAGVDYDSLNTLELTVSKQLRFVFDRCHLSGEQSDGFARLFVALSHACQTSAHRSGEDALHSHSRVLLSLIGEFDLDPHRVLSLMLTSLVHRCYGSWQKRMDKISGVRVTDWPTQYRACVESVRQSPLFSLTFRMFEESEILPCLGWLLRELSHRCFAVTKSEHMSHEVKNESKGGRHSDSSTSPPSSKSRSSSGGRSRRSGSDRSSRDRRDTTPNRQSQRQSSSSSSSSSLSTNSTTKKQSSDNGEVLFRCACLVACALSNRGNSDDESKKTTILTMSALFPFICNEDELSDLGALRELFETKMEQRTDLLSIHNFNASEADQAREQRKAEDLHGECENYRKDIAYVFSDGDSVISDESDMCHLGIASARLCIFISTIIRCGMWRDSCAVFEVCRDIRLDGKDEVNQAVMDLMDWTIDCYRSINGAKQSESLFGRMKKTVSDSGPSMMNEKTNINNDDVEMMVAGGRAAEKKKKEDHLLTALSDEIFSEMNGDDESQECLERLCMLFHEMLGRCWLFLYRRPTLFTMVCRVLLDCCHSALNANNVSDQCCKEDDSSLTVDIYAKRCITHVLCAYSLFEPPLNVGISLSVWNLLDCLSFGERFQMYGHWKHSIDNVCELRMDGIEAKKRMKYFLRRYNFDDESMNTNNNTNMSSSSNSMMMGGSSGGGSTSAGGMSANGSSVSGIGNHHNSSSDGGSRGAMREMILCLRSSMAVTVIPEMITQLKQYTQNIAALVESLRYLTVLERDVFVWCLLCDWEQSASKHPIVVPETAKYDPRFMALARMFGHFFHIFSDVRLQPVIVFVLQCLHKRQSSAELLILSEIIRGVTKVEAFGETCSDLELSELSCVPDWSLQLSSNDVSSSDSSGISSTTTDSSNAYDSSQVVSGKSRTIRRLVKCLFRSRLLFPLFSLLSQQLLMLNSRDNMNEVPNVETLTFLVDETQKLFIQLDWIVTRPLFGWLLNSTPLVRSDDACASAATAAASCSIAVDIAAQSSSALQSYLDEQFVVDYDETRILKRLCFPNFAECVNRYGMSIPHALKINRPLMNYQWKLLYGYYSEYYNVALKMLVKKLGKKDYLSEDRAIIDRVISKHKEQFDLNAILDDFRNMIRLDYNNNNEKGKRRMNRLYCDLDMTVDIWDYISPDLYFTFWSLDLRDLEYPTDPHNRREAILAAQLRRLRRAAAALSAADRVSGSSSSSSSASSSGSSSSRSTPAPSSASLARENQIRDLESRINKIRKAREEAARNQECVESVTVARFRPPNLKEEGKKWTDWFHFSWNFELSMSVFLNECILPRILLDDVDSLYCSAFIKRIVELGVKNFQIHVFTSILVRKLLPLLFSATSDDARRLGRFLASVLGLFEMWRTDDPNNFNNGALHSAPLEQWISYTECVKINDLRRKQRNEQIQLLAERPDKDTSSQMGSNPARSVSRSHSSGSAPNGTNSDEEKSSTLLTRANTSDSSSNGSGSGNSSSSGGSSIGTTEIGKKLSDCEKNTLFDLSELEQRLKESPRKDDKVLVWMAHEDLCTHYRQLQYDLIVFLVSLMNEGRSNVKKNAVLFLWQLKSVFPKVKSHAQHLRKNVSIIHDDSDPGSSMKLLCERVMNYLSMNMDGYIEENAFGGRTLSTDDGDSDSEELEHLAKNEQHSGMDDDEADEDDDSENPRSGDERRCESPLKKSVSVEMQSDHSKDMESLRRSALHSIPRAKRTRSAATETDQPGDKRSPKRKSISPGVGRAGRHGGRDTPSDEGEKRRRKSTSARASSSAKKSRNHSR